MANPGQTWSSLVKPLVKPGQSLSNPVKAGQVCQTWSNSVKQGKTGPGLFKHPVKPLVKPLVKLLGKRLVKIWSILWLNFWSNLQKKL